MEQLSHKISLYMLRHDLIQDNQLIWCQYMVTHRLMGFISCILLVPLGAIISNFSCSLFFFFFFRFLRSRTGGFHAKTPHGCIIFSTMNHLFFLFLIRSLFTPLSLLIVLIPTLIIILVLSPANNAKLHLSCIEYAALKPKILFRVLLSSALAGILSYINIEIASAITMSLLSVAFLLILFYLGYGQQ